MSSVAWWVVGLHWFSFPFFFFAYPYFLQQTEETINVFPLVPKK